MEIAGIVSKGRYSLIAERAWVICGRGDGKPWLDTEAPRRWDSNSRKPRSHPRVKRMLSHSLPGLRSGWAAPKARAEPAQGLHSRPDGRTRWIGTLRAELARLVGLGAPLGTQHPQSTFSASVHPRELLKSCVRHSVASEVLNLNDEK